MRFVFEDPIDSRFKTTVEADDVDEAVKIFAENSLDLAGSMEEATIYANSFICMEV